MWSDIRNGKIDDDGRIENSDIYLYNLSTNEETKVSYSGSGFVPAIYGDRVVWTDTRNGLNNTDIYMYNISTHNETQVSHSENAWNSAIYGNRIVWVDSRSGKSDIYMYDLSTSKETRISYSGSAFNLPGIYGNNIVWNDFRNENMSDNVPIQGIVNYDIYMYNLSTNKETQISHSQEALLPKIYGDRVVWMDYRNRNSDIYMYDLSNNTESQITGSKTASDPAIYGNRVVWRDRRNSNGSSADIYMYDLSSQKETRITTSGSTWDADIYGNKIVWTVSPTEGNIGDIYIGNLKSLIANFSASPNTGNAPLNVKFTDKSLGSPNVWTWDFGDGANSTQRDPMHIYSKAGNYTVTLAVSNADGTDTNTSEINVQNAPPKIPGDFSFLIFLMILLNLLKKSR